VEANKQKPRTRLVANLLSARRWREENAGDVFSTHSAWEWFRRQHAEELVRRGVLIPGRGRRGDLVTPDIDGVVLDILHREAGSTAEGRGDA
jgi:hypothetical protein